MGDGKCGDLDGRAFGSQSVGETGANGKIGKGQEEWLKMGLSVDIRKDLGDFVLESKFETSGEVTGILGASGCGKSMTLRCIAGIVKPDQGRIVLDGEVFFDSERGIDIRPQKRHVGYLFQNYALFPNMTVQQNLMTGLLAYEKDKRKARAAVGEMMERFYLTELAQHRPSQLSGGQQQRAALARILLSRPKILMLDEPFSALDDFLRWKLELELLEVLKAFAGDTLFVSHSRDEVYRLCDRVCVMEQGKTGAMIPVKELFEQPSTKAAALLSGCKNYSQAHQDGEGYVFALDWGIRLRCDKEIPEDLRDVGVRSHYVCPISEAEAQGQENVIACEVIHVVEDVFSVVVMVWPLTASRREDQIRVDVSKELWREFSQREDVKQKLWVRIAPKDVMLLR